MNDETIRVGDILRVSCAFTPTRVVKVSDWDMSIVWPWEQVDPDSEVRWDGQYAIPRRQGLSESRLSLFQTNPAPWTLSAGDSCSVGIPEQLVRVIDIGHFEISRLLGQLRERRKSRVVASVGGYPVEALGSLCAS
ncbi:hypothetical protein K4B79_47165 [Streptomyces lincolnensis]|uniref:hypothetical protein n=1 Tax=Streptomyces lincolnensis TaxID=1915 RepID=UPI001E44CB1C|nr:hypothetical protein [Streptomyces lincolnensis]MCD7445737.1 hypothetical protein [Streptomyces lincolnensis]